MVIQDLSRETLLGEKTQQKAYEFLRCLTNVDEDDDLDVARAFFQHHLKKITTLSQTVVALTLE